MFQRITYLSLIEQVDFIFEGSYTKSEMRSKNHMQVMHQCYEPYCE